MLRFLWYNPKPSGTEYEYQLMHSFENRKKESARLIAKYPNLIPMIFEKSDQCYLPTLKKSTMLLKKELTVGQVLLLIRTELKMKSDENLYLLINNEKVPSITDNLNDIYQKYSHKDGFIYVTYTNESTSE